MNPTVKRYGLLVSYAATAGVKSPSTGRWIIEPADAHWAVVGWDDHLADAQASCARVAEELVGVSNITAVDVIDTQPTTPAATTPVDIEIDQDWALTITVELTDDQIRLLAQIEEKFRAAQLDTSAAIYADTGEQSETSFWPFLINVKDRAAAIRVGRTPDRVDAPAGGAS